MKGEGEGEGPGASMHWARRRRLRSRRAGARASGSGSRSAWPRLRRDGATSAAASTACRRRIAPSMAQRSAPCRRCGRRWCEEQMLPLVWPAVVRGADAAAEQIVQLLSTSTVIFKPERQPQASEKFMLIFIGVQFQFKILDHSR